MSYPVDSQVAPAEAAAPSNPCESPSSFLAHFNQRMFEALARVETHNYDERRAEHTHGRPPWTHPRDAFDPERAAREYNAVLSACPAIHQVLTLLDDDVSRDRLIELLLFRVLGHRHIRLAANSNAYWAGWDLGLSRVVEYNTRGYGNGYPRLLQNMFHRFRVEFDGHAIELESVLFNFVWSFLHRQYYLDRPGIVVRPEPGDVVIDGGACWGESALAFAATVGPRGRVFSYEMDPVNLQTLRANLARNPQLAPRVTIVERALDETADREVGVDIRGIASRMCEGEGKARALTDSIDALVARERLERLDFIKLDIESAEVGALRGAVETMRRFRPKLAVAIYHKRDHLLVIPRIVKLIEDSYRLAIEHYTIDVGETVLYATPR